MDVVLITFVMLYYKVRQYVMLMIFFYALKFVDFELQRMSTAPFYTINYSKSTMNLIISKEK